jgi:cell wall-associated NlpC family hydrolase
MRLRTKMAAAFLLCGLALNLLSAQSQTGRVDGSGTAAQVQSAQARRDRAKQRAKPVVLSPDDGLSVITAALDAHVQAARQRDCSHLVHAIYLRAGFSYPYASSSDLYDGADDFQRVTRPQPGDLVVWPGHVGIVVSPAEHSFFSRLRSGPGVDAYDAPYWKERGQARFFRYIKNAPAHVATMHQVRTQRRK